MLDTIDAALDQIERAAQSSRTIREPKASLDFLRAVYSNGSLPLSVRMRAAIAALPFESPKLAVTANIPGEGFAELLEARLRRIAETKNSDAKMIENEPVRTGGW